MKFGTNCEFVGEFATINFMNFVNFIFANFANSTKSKFKSEFATHFVNSAENSAFFVNLVSKFGINSTHFADKFTLFANFATLFVRKFTLFDF